MKNIFRGLGVALVTPFDEGGNVDYSSLERILARLLESRADFLCVLGSTAETACLSEGEQAGIKEFVCSHVGGRIPILLGMGSNNTQALVERVHSFNLQGVDGLLSVSPFYNKPSQEGIYRHFKALSDATDKPIVIYNVPSRTGSNITAPTALRLAEECPNVVALKEASGNMPQIEQILREKPIEFDVLSGDDSITAKLIGMGAVGVISVIGNALPKEFGELVHSALQGDAPRARTIDEALSPFYQLLSRDGNPAGIKALLSGMGLCHEVLRLPLLPAGSGTKAELMEVLAHLHD